MTDHLQPSAGHRIAVHLLDSAQGHPLQTWRFTDQELITIGRNDGNDIVLSDQHVSRAHATIALEDETWRIVSIGRNGTLVDDRLISEAPLKHQTVFRLGAEGPMLRFDTDIVEMDRCETINHVGGDSLAMLEVDETRKQQEVEQIVNDDLFRRLKEQSRRSKAATMDDTATR